MRLATKVESWADFSNALFSQRNGIVARTFTDAERQAFYSSNQYEQINQILISLMNKFGVSNGANPKRKSGKFIVRVPASLHEFLAIEAGSEGVSLNQLAVAKLAIPLCSANGGEGA
jgi:hypothetical protein